MIVIWTTFLLSLFMLKKPTPLECPVEVTLRAIGGKWKPVILFYLSEKPLRFSELSRAIKGITQKMLTKQLREMESDGLLKRKVFPEIPPRVEYSITPYGKTLNPILASMSKWGEEHKRYSQTHGFV